MEIIILCIQIFFIRILDVSLGTFRTIITVKEKKVYASLIGFFEILIWFLIVREALNTTHDSLWIAVSYASGFALGTYLGSILSSKFISGVMSYNIITEKAYPYMVENIRNAGFAVTVINAEGIDKKKKKYLLLIEINKKKTALLHKIIKENDKNAFISVNETKYIYNGFMGNAR